MSRSPFSLLLRRPALIGALLAVSVVAAGCGGAGGDGDGEDAAKSTTTAAAGASSSATGGQAGPPTTLGKVVGSATSRTADGDVALQVTEVATGLDTVWELAWDADDNLWFTERGGRLSRLGGPTVDIDGVVEQGESGLMGLEIATDGTQYLMFTTTDDNRVVRRAPDGSQQVLVDGIRKAAIHDGGRIRLGPDGTLFVSTGDAGVPRLSQESTGLNGRILAVDTKSGEQRTFALGLRNTQGLCFADDGRLFSTEHGPNEGDEINILTDGFNGQWPDRTGNGIKNWTPTIAPAGCAVYEADLIPEWKGSMLFVTLKERDLRRLTLRGDRVVDEEILFDGDFGRLRAVRVGPDGAVYVATSNQDGRGSPGPSDDRILRIAPA